MMELDQSGDRPIYIVLAEWIEDSILSGIWPEGSQIPSVAEMSAHFRINHVTALRGVSILADRGMLYKKRGIGMFVAEGAAELIKKERREEFYERYIRTAIEEAKKLGITEDDIIRMIGRDRHETDA